VIDPRLPDFTSTPCSPARPRFGYAPLDRAAPARVTIATPFFRPGALFRETARSVLAQSFQRFEWLVVNDASDDPASLAVLDELRAADPRIRVVLHERNRGLSAARNTAFANARTDFVFLLDDDDLLEPTAVEKTLACLVSHPELAFANGFHVGFGAQRYVWERGFHHGAAFLYHNLAVCHALVRRSAFEAAGGFDEAIVDGLEDWDFWLRCADRGLWGATIPEPLSWYRRRPDHAARWRNLAHPEAIAAFRARLRERYPRLYAGGFPRLGPSRGGSRRASFEANELSKTGRRALVALPACVPDRELVEQVERLAGEGFAVTIAVARALDPSTRARIARTTPDVFVPRDFLAAADHARFVRHLAASRRPDLVLGGGEALARSSVAGDSLLERLRTQAALDEIESSRSWRAVQWLARRRWLRGAREAGSEQDAGARLARIQASPAYRWIQAVKRSALYRRWARRRFGSDWELARSASPL
jgi:glycosyltransferase involved in cell wall biosynthesis